MTHLNEAVKELSPLAKQNINLLLYNMSGLEWRDAPPAQGILLEGWMEPDASMGSVHLCRFERNGLSSEEIAADQPDFRRIELQPGKYASSVFAWGDRHVLPPDFPAFSRRRSSVIDVGSDLAVLHAGALDGNTTFVANSEPVRINPDGTVSFYRVLANAGQAVEAISLLATMKGLSGSEREMFMARAKAHINMLIEHKRPGQLARLGGAALRAVGYKVL
jgi:hypothetical protein